VDECKPLTPGVIILPGGTRIPNEKKGEKKVWTWDQVKTEEDVLALFRDHFPDAFGRGRAVQIDPGLTPG